MAYEKLSPKTKQRMRSALRWRKQGLTLEQVGRRLKVTRERVRQLQRLGEHLKEKGML